MKHKKLVTTRGMLCLTGIFRYTHFVPEFDLICVIFSILKIKYHFRKST